VPSVHARRRAVLLATVLALAVLLFLAFRACGSSQDDARDTAQAFVDDAAKGSPRVCDLLSSRLIQERTNRSGDAARRQCRSNAQAAGARVSASLPRDIRVTDVTTDGDHATAKLESKGRDPVTLSLVRESGDWKVDALQ
jgi:hypothetical protein